jgi:hypothetical protein
MLYHRDCTESEFFAEMRAALNRRREQAGTYVISTPNTAPNGEFQAFLAVREARRQRSLQTCHHYSPTEKTRHEPPRDTGAFVPATSARIENDRNLTDGTRRCARKLMELAYRTNRDDRSLDITVSYLAKTLQKCRRTVQRYLRQLEREGYIEVAIVATERSRMCFGLVVTLLGPLFPRHHRQKWLENPGKPGATSVSQIKTPRFIIPDKRRIYPVDVWARRCMDGVFRALRTSIGPFPPIEWLGKGVQTATVAPG